MAVLTVTSLAENPSIRPAIEDLYDRGWPAFMSADPIDLECWPRLLELAPHLQLAMVDGDEVVATAHATPLPWDPSQPLPAEGWDWACSSGIAALRASLTTSAASALAITIDPGHRGGGLGAVMFAALLDRAREAGLRWLVAPLRPSRKSFEPLVPFADYVARRRADGLPFDPWLRAHIRVGGRIAATCERSMTISAPIAQWERWSGVPYQAGLPYFVPEALVPIEVDGETGTYVEPNVWVVHDL